MGIVLVWMGIVWALAAVFVLFSSLIVVGFLDEDGPSDPLFLAAIVFMAGLYAGFIALRTGVKAGAVVFLLVPALIIGALYTCNDGGHATTEEGCRRPIRIVPGP
jgi:hypothetical protein